MLSNDVMLLFRILFLTNVNPPFVEPNNNLEKKKKKRERGTYSFSMVELKVFNWFSTT